MWDTSGSVGFNARRPANRMLPELRQRFQPALLRGVHRLGVFLAQVVGSALKSWPLPCDSFCSDSSFQV
ncbi:hypothetical protein Q8A67_019107 [Cirrhinus molitorella]|uniref:Uncharacterized protein n=1 Tax=Cirrhinus molitorella TaxID=172907 RepID=A0AA88PBR5_9TELE|nr:hypothetical protein Q8A67_019107 [Cirrhinus molitorella]